MKILLAGAFGNLGIEILKVLCEGGHEVIAADLKEKENNGLSSARADTKSSRRISRRKRTTGWKVNTPSAPSTRPKKRP